MYSRRCPAQHSASTPPPSATLADITRLARLASIDHLGRPVGSRDLNLPPSRNNYVSAFEYLAVFISIVAGPGAALTMSGTLPSNAAPVNRP